MAKAKPKNKKKTAAKKPVKKTVKKTVKPARRPMAKVAARRLVARKPAKKPAPKPVAKRPAPKAHKPVKPIAAVKPAPAAKPAVAAKPVHAKPNGTATAVAAKPAVHAAKPTATHAPRPAATPPAPAPRKLIFKPGEQIVYPAHGVGRVVQVEEQVIAGAKLELYVVDFDKEKLRLKVPTDKAEPKGMRRLSSKDEIDATMRVLKGRARIKRTMWSRRAQEYEAKINSGDLISVAEVVRDLYRSERQPEQSYSERQLFEQALERMAREVAAVRKIDDDVASKDIEDFLGKHGHKARTEAALITGVAA